MNQIRVIYLRLAYRKATSRTTQRSRHFYRFRRDMDKQSPSLERRFIKRSAFKIILWSFRTRYLSICSSSTRSSMCRSRILSCLRKKESRIQD